MQKWQLHLHVLNSEPAPSCWRMVSWIRHQSRFMAFSCQRKLMMLFLSQSLTLFNRVSWENTQTVNGRLATKRTRQSDCRKTKKTSQCVFYFYQGGGEVFSTWMWLRGRVWAFFSHFPTTGSEVTAETRHCQSAHPPLLARTVTCLSNMSVFCFEL